MRHATTTITSSFVAGALRPCRGTALLQHASHTARPVATPSIRNDSLRPEKTELGPRRWQSTTSVPQEAVAIQWLPPIGGPTNHSDEAKVSTNGPGRKSVSRRKLDVLESPILQHYDKISKEQMYEYLEKRKLSAQAKTKTLLAVAYLIRMRGETPNLRIFSNLILSLCHSQAGSAAWLASYLEEVKEMGLEPDSELCHNALKVLAVHPDYLLREEILEYMRSMWFSLSDEGRHFVVAGQLREGSIEMALDGLESMVSSGIEVQDWLYDMAMYVLLDVGEAEEVVHLAQLSAAKRKREISGVIWFRLLDLASSSLNHLATSYVWKRRVQSESLNPSSGQCLDVLKTAARHGDIDLATDVFRLLGKRKTTFDMEHYELLLNAYVSARDYEGAFKVLSIMKEANMNPDMGCTRVLVQHLRVHPVRCLEAFDKLQSVKDSHSLPPTALNALLEAFGIYNFAKVFDWFRDFKHLCGSAPDLETYNVMLQKCGQHSHKKAAAMFLASEMVASEITPDKLTYDRLVLVCVKSHELDDAYGYLLEMQERGFKPRLGTLFFFARSLAPTGDPRTLTLMEMIKTHGPEVEEALRFVRERYDAAQRQTGEQDGAAEMFYQLPAS